MNQRADFIIPECYIDTNLVETLVCTGGCNHQKGCNKDPRFKRLFRTMKGLGEIKLMESLISYLASNTYQASNDMISEIFKNNV